MKKAGGKKPVKALPRPNWGPQVRSGLMQKSSSKTLIFAGLIMTLIFSPGNHIRDHHEQKVWHDCDGLHRSQYGEWSMTLSTLMIVKMIFDDCEDYMYLTVLQVQEGLRMCQCVNQYCWFNIHVRLLVERNFRLKAKIVHFSGQLCNLVNELYRVFFSLVPPLKVPSTKKLI